MYLGLAHSVSGFFGPTANLLGHSAMSATAEIQQLESLRVALGVVILKSCIETLYNQAACNRSGFFHAHFN
jgi:hypothetical protein